MSLKKESKDRSFIKRKGGNQMTTVQATSTKAGEKSHEKPFEKFCEKFYIWLYNLVVGSEKPSVTSVEQSSQDALIQFEREIIQECQEMGMSDDEIQKWMEEI